MLEQTQATLDDHVLQDGSRGHVNGAALGGHDDDGSLEGHATAQIDSTSNGEVVELDDLGDGGDVLGEVGDLLEVAAKLDEGSVTETAGAHLQLAVLDGVQVGLDEHKIRASLDGQETPTRHVNTVGIVEMPDGSTDSGLQLDDADVALTLLVAGNGLAVGDNLHLQLVVLHHALDGLDVHPDVVGVEVLELLDRLELVDVLLGNLSNLQQAHGALVVDDGTTLDIGLGLVGQLHDVLRVGLHHVLQDAQVDNSAQVVHIGQEDDLDTTLQQLVQNARVVERLENVTVAGRVPFVDWRVKGLGDGEERVLVDSGVSGLVEGEDVDVVALVLLDDGRGIVVGVERVHQDERHVRVISAVQVLDLSHGKVQEGHAITDLNDGLGANATHGSTETTIQLQNSQLVQELDSLRVGKVVVVDHLALSGWRNAVPVTVCYTVSQVVILINSEARGEGAQTQHCPWPCRSGISGTERRSYPSPSQTASSRRGPSPSR